MDSKVDIVKDLESELIETFRSSLWRLLELWDEVGIVGETRVERIQVVMKYLTDLLNEMVSEEEGLKDKLFRLIKENTEQIEELAHQLNVDPSLGVGLHDDGFSSLLEREKMLKQKLKQLIEKKEVQMKAYNALREREAPLCKILQIQPHEVQNEVPTESDLNEIREHVKMLQSEKSRREKEFYALREEISKLMEELETSPGTSFEHEVINSGEDEFILSCENIIAVKDLKRQLQNKRHQIEVQCKELMERLKILWSILNTEVEEQQTILSRIKGNNPSSLRVLQQEVCRYEVLKTQNIQKVLNKLKEDIRIWSAKCLYSDSETVDFENPPFDEPSEELLNYYDSELQKLHQFYNDNLNIFQRIQKREELWVKMLEFEKKASDPGRFNNRGGALLQEERDRKRLLKAIPKLEKELVALAEEWGKVKGRPFTIRGHSVREYIEDQWQQYEIEKENEKMERQKQKAIAQEDRLMTSRMTTPLKHKMVQATSSSRIYGKCPRTDSKLVVRASYTPYGKQQTSVVTPRRSPRFASLKKATTPLADSRMQHDYANSRALTGPRTRASAMKRYYAESTRMAPSRDEYNASQFSIKGRLHF